MCTTCLTTAAWFLASTMPAGSLAALIIKAPRTDDSANRVEPTSDLTEEQAGSSGNDVGSQLTWSS